MKGKENLDWPSITNKEIKDIQNAIIVNSTPGEAFHFSLLKVGISFSNANF